MGNPNFSISIDVTGVQFFTPGAPIDRLSAGVHPAKILSAEQDPSKDEGKSDNIHFVAEVTEGPDKGKKAGLWLPVNPGEPDSVTRKHWKNLLTSVVKDPAALEGGPRAISAKLFVGKPVHIFAQPVEGKDEKGRDKLPNLNFITADQAKNLKAQAKPGANGSGSFKAEGAAPAGTGAPKPLELD